MFCSLTSLAIPGPKHDEIIERNVASLSRVAVRLARGEPAAMAVIGFLDQVSAELRKGSEVMTHTSLRLLLGGCLALVIASPPVAAEELRIGLIVPVTGPFAQVGKDMADGLNMYLAETSSDFAGAKVKLIIEDSQAKPDTAVTRAKKLTLQDKVHILLGGVLATERLRDCTGEHQ